MNVVIPRAEDFVGEPCDALLRQDFSVIEIRLIQMRTSGVPAHKAARKLGISVCKAYGILARIYQKSRTSNVPDLTKWAVEKGISEGGSPDRDYCVSAVSPLTLSLLQLKLVHLRSRGVTKVEAARRTGLARDGAQAFARIYSKLGIHSVAELTRWAIEHRVEHILEARQRDETEHRPTIRDFSESELQVLYLRMNGARSEEVASRLRTSPSRVRGILKRFCKAFGDGNLALLTAWAIREGIDQRFPAQAEKTSNTPLLPGAMRFSEREWALIKMRTSGVSKGDMARHLATTSHGVECLLSRIYQKLGSNDVVILTKWATTYCARDTG